MMGHVVTRAAHKWLVSFSTAASALVLVGGTVSSMSSATAAPMGAERFCRGLAATIVGSQDGFLEGTLGNDVIVSNGANAIDASGGDDVICVTGRFEHLERLPVLVLDSEGDDLVDTSAQKASYDGVTTNSYTGSDTLLGGPGHDWVNLCPAVDAELSGGRDDQPDVVIAGAGDDSVEVCARGGGRDDIDLGDGNDAIFVDDPAGYTGRVTAGPGRNALTVYESERNAKQTSWTIDLASGHARATGAISSDFTWDRVNRVSFPYLAGRLDATGTDGPDVLKVGEIWTYPEPRAMISADLGSGDDRFASMNTIPSTGSVLDLGDGINSIAMSTDTNRRVSIDLERDELVVRRAAADAMADVLGHATVRGVRTAHVIAPIVDLHGAARSQNLYAKGCDVHVDGGRGADRVVVLDKNGCSSRSRRHEGNGGPGNDVLLGGRSDDILRGGDGDDQAFARGGVDICDVEDAHGCERDVPGDSGARTRSRAMSAPQAGPK